MVLGLDDLRTLAGVLLLTVGSPRNRPRRAHRRGELGLEALQIAIFAAVLSALAVAVGIAITRRSNEAVNKIQSP